MQIAPVRRIPLLPSLWRSAHAHKNLYLELKVPWDTVLSLVLLSFPPSPFLLKGGRGRREDLSQWKAGRLHLLLKVPPHWFCSPLFAHSLSLPLPSSPKEEDRWAQQWKVGVAWCLFHPIEAAGWKQAVWRRCCPGEWSRTEPVACRMDRSSAGASSSPRTVGLTPLD